MGLHKIRENFLTSWRKSVGPSEEGLCYMELLSEVTKCASCVANVCLFRFDVAIVKTAQVARKVSRCIFTEWLFCLWRKRKGRKEGRKEDNIFCDTTRQFLWQPQSTTTSSTLPVITYPHSNPSFSKLIQRSRRFRRFGATVAPPGRNNRKKKEETVL